MKEIDLETLFDMYGNQFQFQFHCENDKQRDQNPKMNSAVLLAIKGIGIWKAPKYSSVKRAITFI